MAKKSVSRSGGYKLKKLQLTGVMYSEDDIKPPAERDGIRIGVANGLNITHFTNELFFANFDARLTDDELTDALHAEFPNRLKAGKVIQDIKAYRNYYNGNVHGHGQGEKLDGEYRLPAFGPDGEVAKRTRKPKEGGETTKKSAKSPAKATAKKGAKKVAKKATKKATKKSA